MANIKGQSPWESPETKTSWWRKPANRVWGAVGAIILTALTAWLAPPMTKVMQSLTDAKEPVGVRVDVEESWYPVALPAGMQLSEQELEYLNGLPPDDQRTYLRKLGGVHLQGDVAIRLTLTGQQTEGVRVTDIKHVGKCSVPPTDSVVVLAGGFGAIKLPTSMNLIVDKYPSRATYVDESGEGERDFFPTKTITLARGEQDVLVVNAVTRTHYCEFVLEMTVEEGTETIVQRIDHGGRAFVRTPLMPSGFDRVYLGGYVCNHFVERPGEALTGPPDCGAPDNFGEYAVPID